MKNVFDKEVSNEIIGRINQLNHETKPVWGKMNVGQMLAHCNVTYDMDFTDDFPKATGMKKFLLTLFIKNGVVGEKPYPKNGRTAPQFLITDKRVFEDEKTKLIHYITKVQQLGTSHYEGRASVSFGELKANEWNNMFYKHLDHHLSQFGV
tara:strand:+ start:32855 stop:33307 length:453 start_codon:yes stop_codon:yes gene_type:complete